MGVLSDLARELRLALKRRAYGGAGRDRWQRPDAIVAALGIRPGMRVADLGSGVGFFTFRLAAAVGPDGLVFAVDTDPDLRFEVARRASTAGAANVRVVAVGRDRLVLPERVDLVFLSNVYHHLPDQAGYFRAAAAWLAPGGRIAILEHRPGGLAQVFRHATPPDAIRAAMASAGYELVATPGANDRQSLQLFAPRA